MSQLKDFNWFYYVAFLRCSVCSKSYYLTTRSLSEDSAVVIQRFECSLRCPKCCTTEKPEVEDLIPFPIGHLEEFIVWTSDP